MFSYPLRVRRDDNGTWLVTAPDLPELTTFVEELKELEPTALKALTAVIAHRMAEGQDVPLASGKRARWRVSLPTLLAAKVALYRAMREARVTQVTLARTLNCDPRQVRRMLDPTSASRLDQIEAALRALGKRLDVMVREAA